MKKFIKTLSIMLIAAVCTVCVALFAACGGDDNKLDPNIIYITVVDENGDAIDGTTFGENILDPDDHQVMIQFCTVDGGCASMVELGADGKAEYDLASVKELAETNHTDTVELHIQNLPNIYKVEYNQYKVSEIPQEIKVTLQKV